MIAACAPLSAPPPLAVSVPSDCDRHAVPVPYPPIRREDLGVRAGRFAAALVQANGRLIAVAECHAQVRDALARP